MFELANIVLVSSLHYQETSPNTINQHGERQEHVILVHQQISDYSNQLDYPRNMLLSNSSSNSKMNFLTHQLNYRIIPVGSDLEHKVQLVSRHSRAAQMTSRL